MPEITTKEYVSKERFAQYDTKIKALIKDIVAKSAYDDSSIKTQIKANKTAIDTLNGDATQVGSVAKQVADAVASIVANAPEAYDTLVEISDWISSHSNDASAMNTSILANTNAINALKALVGTLPDGTAAKTIIEYIDSKVTGVKDWTADINAAKTEAISTAAGDATTKADKALTDAKTYADGLATNYATAAQGAKADTAVQPADLGTGAYMNLTEVTEEYINSLFTASSN